jgi:hypothetical protein
MAVHHPPPTATPEDNIGERQCPALGAQLPDAMEPYYPRAQLPVYLRPISDNERKTIQRFLRETGEARDHFRLFRIFGANYDELVKVISQGVLKIGLAPDDERIVFDRVFLNLLASGKAITDHFSKYLTAKFGVQKRREFREYLKRLREASWAFAFMEDVRNYVQHQGLPIVDYTRSFSATSVKLSITINAEKLAVDTRAWPNSKLTAQHGTLEVFDLVSEYYLRISRDLANFLAKWLVPNFVEAHKFFATLAGEVKRAVPNGRVILLEQYVSANHKHSFSFIELPENVFGELGISVGTKLNEDTREFDWTEKGRESQADLFCLPY